jgi:isoleucyl-tRNA synthetase
MSVSDEILKRTADSYRRIRNTVRYLLSNLDEFDPDKDCVDFKDMIELDRWVIHKTAKLQEQIISHYNKYEFHQLYQALHNFCILDLGGLYLDIIKDRMYTTPAQSPARRSAQTATYHIVQSLLRWMAPILSFTAEEALGHIPNNKQTTIFTSTWIEQSHILNDDERLCPDHWDVIFEVRQNALKVLEEGREQGVIGSGLDADVAIYCEDKTRNILSLLENELRFVLITSNADLCDLDSAPATAQTFSLSNNETLKVEIVKSDNNKCVRCWHLRDDVGSNSQHPELCSRCVENIEGAGEVRHYA